MREVAKERDVVLDTLVSRLAGLTRQAEVCLEADSVGADDWNRIAESYEDVRKRLTNLRLRPAWCDVLPMAGSVSLGYQAKPACATFASEMRAVLDSLWVAQPPTQDGNLQASLTSRQKKSQSVFVVHGHDNEMKQEVARFIEKLGLTAIILHEQPNVGAGTLIEKFEEHANVDYAIVLVSPDDVGHVAGQVGEAAPRARQNVIFELGFFCGKLGRGKTCLLERGHPDMPSDLAGVLYARYERADWRTELARSMKATGLPVDLNKVL